MQVEQMEVLCPAYNIIFSLLGSRGLEGKEGYEEAKVSGEHQSCYSGQIESQHHDVTLYYPPYVFFPPDF